MVKTEAQKAATNRWRAANAEHVRVTKAAWHKANRVANPEKVHAAENAWYAANREAVCRRMRAARLNNVVAARQKVTERKWAKHGIAPAIIAARPVHCQLCIGVNKSGRALALDHDHETGAFRGWLCDTCNRMLGFAKDNPALLEAAAIYLRKAR